MLEASYLMNRGYGPANDIEVLDMDSLDEVAGGFPPLLVAAGIGFGVGFGGTAALIAGWWAK